MIQNLLKYHLAHLCNIAINWSFWIIITIFYHIIQWHYYINIFSINYFYFIYFTFTINKWSTVFKCYTFISFICLPCCCIISCSCNCYSSFNKYVCITIITLTRFWGCSLKSNVTVSIILSSWLIIYLNPSFCS